MSDKTNAIFDELGKERSARISRESINLSTNVTGRVLVLTAHLDNLLYGLIETSMPSLDRKTRETLFEGTGPLGTFSSKIYLAKAMGLIDPQIANELHKLRKIRNKFAHAANLLNWAHPQVAELVSKLAGAEAGKPSRSFATAMRAAVRALSTALDQAKQGAGSKAQ